MDIQYYGANCVVVSNKHVRIVIDDNLATLGAKQIVKDGDVCLFTGPHDAIKGQPKIVIDQPGEYEVSGVSVFGLQARSHMDEDATKSSVIYKLSIGDLRIVVTGHIYPKLTDSQLEAIGMIDLLVVPVGGNGYTLDATGALEIIKNIEPKLVVLTHYADSSLNYPVPQQSLEDVLKNIPMEPKDTVKKLQLKSSELSDSTQLMIIERS